MATPKPGVKRHRDGNSASSDYHKASNGAPPVAAAAAPRKRRRWDSKPAAPSGHDSKREAQVQQAELIRQQIAERLKNLKNIQLPNMAGGGLGSVGGLRSMPPVGLTPGFGNPPNFNSMQHIKSKGFSGMSQTRQQIAQQKKWVPLRLDAKGRQIDEQGNVIKMEREATTTLKINQKLLQREQQKLQPSQPKTGKLDDKYLDPRITVADKRSIARRRKALSFIKQGKFQRKAQALRMEQISHQLRQDRGSQLLGKGAAVLPARPIQVDELPDIEWWDEKVLGLNSSYDDFNQETVPTSVTIKIHHPVPLAPPCEEEPPGPRPLMLTKKERKKIRRMNKLEKERERQDLVSAGLAPPKEPRLKLSNMMAILMDEAISDPSAVEAKVRAQMAKRAQAHLEHNAGRKLSKQQRSEKLRNKLKEDTNIKSYVSIYRIPDISQSKQIRFKIDANAQQYNMTGVGVICDTCSVIVLEGGPKGTKKFKGIMLRRIKWQAVEEAGEKDEEDDEDSGEEDEEEVASQKKAKLVWEGVQSQRKFLNFRFETCRSESAARTFFADKGLENYWDQCLNDKHAAAASEK
ncbi:hypothetical protein AAMO2058_000890700 [Amorphochlora amoebiformis]